ncbi:amino acid/polyamine transporter I [Aspergillus pseudocaelatus]|uniref:Amino acid/polyamine transporter I n=1 Tax=Aspergillus pseudocaelatus TaxID=1825620 RepID=A0ABQ6WYE8_9EURO|nr:amino acid/polyamine transporter I [Aspergillus pseudocaelatus]
MDNQNDVDDQALEAQGYTRAMPRRFSPLSLLSLGFAMTATWNGFGSAIETSLAEASSSGTIWTLIIAALMNLVVSLGMAELVSAYPNSGAQYYWSFRVARSDWAPFASSACVSTCGWWLGLASVCNFVAAMVLAMLHLCVEGYTVSPWHQWLCYTSILWLAVAFNIFGTRFLPTFNRLLLYFSLSTLLISVVIILGCAAPNFQSTTWVFADLKSSNQSYVRGFLLILCLLNNTYGFMGTDAGAHLAEEIPSPATNAPKVIVYPIIIGLVTAWPFAVACMYVIVDIEKVVNPPSGIGLIEIYYQATGSKALTIILLAAFAFCLFGCAVANITGSSRQIWAASRDNCYPLSTWWSRIHPQFQMPVNAAVLSAIFTTLYGLIYVGSTTAFTSMVSANIVFMMTSYVIPQGILAWRGRSTVLPGRPFDLGKWGQLVNVTSCLWVAFLDVVACFPTTLPVTASNMNWVSVVILAFAAYTLMAWCLWQRHVFKGPGVNLLVQEQYALIPRDSNDGVSKDVKGE